MQLMIIKGKIYAVLWLRLLDQVGYKQNQAYLRSDMDWPLLENTFAWLSYVVEIDTKTFFTISLTSIAKGKHNGGGIWGGWPPLEDFSGGGGKAPPLA